MPSAGSQSSAWAGSLDRLLKGAREVEAPQSAPASAPAPFGFLDVGPASTEIESTDNTLYTDSVTLDEFIAGNIGGTSRAAKEHIADVIRRDLAGDFARATSIYDQRLDGESVEDFVRRTHPNYQPFRGKKIDGEITEYLKRMFRDYGYLDGKLFTRSVLRKIDSAADEALKNFLRTGSLPNELPLPNKWGQSKSMVHGLTDEQLRAARSLANARKL